MMSPLQILAGAGIAIALEQMILVRDIERGQDGKTRRIHGMGLLGYGAHLGIDVLSQLNDVVSVGAAKIVGLIENLHTDSVIAGIFQRRMFGDGCHNSSLLRFGRKPGRSLLSSRPALRQLFQSVAASSPRAREYLPAPYAVLPSRDAWFRLLPRALRSARATVGHRVPRPSAPLVPPCTAQ